MCIRVVAMFIVGAVWARRFTQVTDDSLHLGVGSLWHSDQVSHMLSYIGWEYLQYICKEIKFIDIATSAENTFHLLEPRLTIRVVEGR